MLSSPDDFNPESRKIIAAIRAGDYSLLNDYYDDHREAFLKWARKKFSALERYLDDAWQDATVTFFDQVKKGKITDLSCSVMTYLCGVSKKLLLKRGYQERRFVWKDKIDEDIKQHDFMFEDPWEEEKLKLLWAMNQLPPKCQNILKKRYFDGLTIEELAEEHQTTKNNVSSTLSQCLKKLKAIIKQIKK